MTTEIMAGISVIIVPLAGWIVSVERRISELRWIIDKVDKVDTKVDILLAHALETKKWENRVETRVAEPDRA